MRNAADNFGPPLLPSIRAARATSGGPGDGGSPTPFTRAVKEIPLPSSGRQSGVSEFQDLIFEGKSAQALVEFLKAKFHFSALTKRYLEATQSSVLLNRQSSLITIDFSSSNTKINCV